MMKCDKMDPDKKHSWLVALRSDRYIQKRESLFDRENHNRLCCIGVGACAVTEKHDIINALASAFGREMEYYEDDGNDQTDDAAKALGVIDLDFVEVDSNGYERAGKVLPLLVKMNDDDCKSFHEIADWVEENL